MIPTVIQNWQTPEVNVESYDFDLYTCAWIEIRTQANQSDANTTSILANAFGFNPVSVTADDR